MSKEAAIVIFKDIFNLLQRFRVIKCGVTQKYVKEIKFL